MHLWVGAARGFVGTAFSARTSVYMQVQSARAAGTWRLARPAIMRAAWAATCPDSDEVARLSDAYTFRLSDSFGLP